MAVDILLLSFYYPPFAGVGARRWGFLSRFFAANGYRVAVLTSPLNGPREAAAAEHDGLSVHVAPLPRRSPRVPRLPFIGEWLTWRRPFRRSIERLIRQERPRLLVFTGGPFFSFALAPALARKFRLPYWLDFRDAWELGGHAPLRCSAPLVRFLERRAVRGARLVTDVTPEMVALRRAAFPGLPPGRFQVLENGFDGNPLAPGAPAPAGPLLRLGIWGKFSPYDAAHPPLLMAAVAELAAEIPVEIHHFGEAHGEKELAAAAARHGLAGALRFHGPCEYEAGISLLAGMDILAVNHRSPLMVGTKVYDAIRVNRPILALCRPGDALARMLRPFRHAYPAATVAAAAAALREVARLRPARLDPGLDPCPYSRQSRARAFLPHLASILEPR